MVFFTEENDPFIIQQNFSTLGSIIEFKPSFIGTQITLTPDDSIRDLLGFDKVVF